MLLTKDVLFEHSSSFQLGAVDLHIKEGEIVSLIGPNGSGKSTLLRLISRLITPKSGEVILDGQLMGSMKSLDVAKKLAMLPQMQDHQLDLTVGELIEFGRYPHRGAYSKLTKEDDDIIQWAMEVTRLIPFKNRTLQSLSGGERQRAWIALAIAQRPKILLLDEPTTFLDISHQLEVMELVEELNTKFGMTVVMVLHDINQAARYSDRLVVLKHGKIQFDGIPQCVLCREMFQSIFEIDADIYKDNGKPFFTPIRLRKEGYV
ncbi:ABC transporter ATP-binding protein [Sporosarcina sp. ANT_H38]|uniref:ABC transporter ATP-binding protein n=1 Tax=Sporosarcina sp. ANT_H38 TaxID=2597358 RepID=UPI0011F3FF1C|nr:ABC transporter ATP-binding protein [Sporosarcina sp. ANT_H38]KAA0955874.1 ABC transporter ATP-binding protein [Sporosarcina sp. ANT_H38]